MSVQVHGEAVPSVQKSAYLHFERDADRCALGTCEYRYAGGDPLEDALSIDAPAGTVLDRFVDIVRLDGESSTNTGSFSVRLTADSEKRLRGFRATFTLRSGGTVIKLGG